MIVETNIDIGMCGLVTETLVDNLGSTYTRIIKDGTSLYDLEANQPIHKVLKGRDYSSGNCTIDWDKKVIDIKSLQDAAKNLKDLTIKTVKPYYAHGGLINNNGLSDGIHPIQRERKMISNNYGDIMDALRYINKDLVFPELLVNPCREIKQTGSWLDEVKKENKVGNTNWKFKSASDADINWKDIKDSVTYAEPLALVTRDYKDYVGNDTYVVVAKELMDKAKMVKIKTPKIAATVEKRVFCVATNFSDWVDWAKAVKTASWPDGLKSTISVILPTV